MTQFVGFLGAYRHPGELNPLLAGSLVGLPTTWVTFLPCFVCIFAGAPYVERLRSNRALAAALIAAIRFKVGVLPLLASGALLGLLFSAFPVT